MVTKNIKLNSLFVGGRRGWEEEGGEHDPLHYVEIIHIIIFFYI